jgi:hypothetical protein
MYSEGGQTYYLVEEGHIDDPYDGLFLVDQSDRTTDQRARGSAMSG